MRNVVASSLIFLLLINICSIGILKLSYESNKAYFTKNFCVNKQKPALKCNGKCHLNKTLKTAEAAKGNENGIQNLNFCFEFIAVNNEFTFCKALGIESLKIDQSLFFNPSLAITILYKPPISV